MNPYSNIAELDQESTINYIGDFFANDFFAYAFDLTIKKIERKNAPQNTSFDFNNPAHITFLKRIFLDPNAELFFWKVLRMK